MRSARQVQMSGAGGSGGGAHRPSVASVGGMAQERKRGLRASTASPWIRTHQLQLANGR